METVTPEYGNVARNYPLRTPTNAFFTRGAGPTMLLCETAGIKYSAFNRFVRLGRFKTGHARRLEIATGVNRLHWLYPKEFGSGLRQWRKMGYRLRSPQGVTAILDFIKSYDTDRIMEEEERLAS